MSSKGLKLGSEKFILIPSNKRFSSWREGTSGLTLTALALTLAACGTAATGSGSNNNNGGNTLTPVVALAAGSNSGLAGDKITNANVVSVDLSNFAANAAVTVTAMRTGESDVTGTAQVGATGTGTVMLGSTQTPLKEGTWALVASVNGAAVATETLTIDRTAPAEATLTIQGITNLNRATAAALTTNGFMLALGQAENGGKLTWTLTKTGSNTPTVLEQTATLGTVADVSVMLPSGVMASDLTDGEYTLMYTLEDVAGNAMAYTKVLGVVTPTPPAVSLVEASDTGALTSDMITNDTTPEFVVKNVEPGTTVTLVAMQGIVTVMATGQVAENGEARITLGTMESPLLEGEWTVSSTVGNLTGTTTVVIDVTAPARATMVAVGSATMLENLAATDVLSSGITLTLPEATNGGTLQWQLTRLGENAPVVVQQTVALSAPTSVKLTLPESVTVTTLTDGTYKLIYTLTDVAGNTSASYEETLGIGVMVATVALTDTSNSGSKADAVTNDVTPEFIIMNVRAAGAITVTLMQGDMTVNATGVANDSGTATITVGTTEAPLGEGAWTVDVLLDTTVVANTMVTIDATAPTAAMVSVEGASATLTDVTAASLRATGFMLVLDQAENGGSLTWTLAMSGATPTVVVTEQTVALREGIAIAALLPESVMASDLADGAYVLTYTLTDVAGNAMEYMTNLTILTSVVLQPTVELAAESDTGVSMVDMITNDVTPEFALTNLAANAAFTVTAMRTGEADVTETGMASEMGAATVTLPTLTNGVWTVTAIVGTDTVATTSVTIDTMAPLEGTVSVQGSATLANLVAATVKEQGFTLTLPAAENGGNVKWTLTRGDTTQVIMEQTVALGETTTATLAVPADVLADALTNGQYTLMYTVADVAGNTATYSRAVAIGEEPTPRLTLAADSNSGSKDDTLTSDTTPTFDLTNLAPNAAVTLTASRTGAENVTETGTASETGTSAVTLPVLSEGEWTVTAMVGTNAAVVATTMVTIDTMAPLEGDGLVQGSATLANLVAATVKEQGFTLTLPAAENGGNVKWTLTRGDTTQVIMEQTVALGETTTATLAVPADVAVTALTAGQYTLMYTVADVAGNTATYSRAVVIIGETLPAVTLTLAADSNSGSKDDTITSDTTPTFDLTNLAPNAAVTLTASRTGAENVTATETASETGTSAVTLPVLSEGEWTVTAMVGTDGPALATTMVTVDTTAPLAGTVTQESITTLSNLVATAVKKQGFTLTLPAAENGGTVTWSLRKADAMGSVITEQTVALGETTAVTLAVPADVLADALTAGQYTLMYTLTDVARNTQSYSKALAIGAPLPAVTLTLEEGSNTGSKADTITNDVTPTFVLAGLATNAEEVTLTATRTELPAVTPVTAKGVAVQGGVSGTFTELTEGVWTVTAMVGTNAEVVATTMVTIDTTAPTAGEFFFAGSSLLSNLSMTVLKLQGLGLQLASSEISGNVKWTLTKVGDPTPVIPEQRITFSILPTIRLFVPDTVPETALTTGQYTLSYTVEDVAGNSATYNKALAIGEVLQGLTPMLALTVGSNTGLTTDTITSDTTPTIGLTNFAGNAEVTLIVSHLTARGLLVTLSAITAMASPEGTAEVTLPELTDNGVWTVTAMVGESTLATLSVTVDNTAPMEGTLAVQGSNTLSNIAAATVKAQGFTLTLPAAEDGGNVKWTLSRLGEETLVITQQTVPLGTEATVTLAVPEAVAEAALTTGQYRLMYTLEDVAGNTASYSTSVAIGAELLPAATLVLAADSNSGSKTDTITNDTTPTFDLTDLAANAALTLTAMREGTGDVTATETASETGAATVTLPYLSDGEWTVEAMVGADTVATLGVTIDTTASNAGGVLSQGSAGLSDLVAAMVKEQGFTLTFPLWEAGGTVKWTLSRAGEETPVIPEQTVMLVATETSTATATLAVPPDVTVEALTTGQYTLMYTFEDVAENTEIYAKALAIGEPLPAPTLTLAADSNSGSKTDTITNDRSPAFTLANFEAGISVRLEGEGFAPGTSRTELIPITGGLTARILPTLTDGEWTITVTRVGSDVAAATVMVTIDGTAPGVGTVSVQGSNTLSDLVAATVKEQGFTLTLPVAENGGTLTWMLTKSGEPTPVIAEQTVTLGETATLTLAVPEAVTVEALTAGQYTLSYTVTDVAGNTATYGAALAIAEPVAPRLTLAAGSNSGDKTDAITNEVDPIFELLGFAANTEVTLVARMGIDSAQRAGTTGVTGALTLEFPGSLGEGEWTVEAMVGTDTIATLSVTIDATTPLEGTITVGRDSTLFNHVASAVKAQGFTLTLPAAENGGTVQWTLTKAGQETPVIMEQMVTLGATPTAMLAVPEDVTAEALTDGIYALMYTVADVAGNTATYSTSLAIGRAVLGLTAASNSGSKTDLITNDRSPTAEVRNLAPGAMLTFVAQFGITNNTTGLMTANAEGVATGQLAEFSHGDLILTVGENFNFFTPGSLVIVMIDTMAPLEGMFSVQGSETLSSLVAATVKEQGFTLTLPAAENGGNVKWTLTKVGEKTPVIVEQTVALGGATATLAVPGDVTAEALANGQYTLMYTVTDVAENTATYSASVAIGEVLFMLAADSSRGSQDDTITNDPTPTFTVTNLAANAELVATATQGLLTAIGTGTADETGAATLTLPRLSDGVWTVAVMLVGSGTVATLSVTIDATAPASGMISVRGGTEEELGDLVASTLKAQGFTLTTSPEPEAGTIVKWALTRVGEPTPVIAEQTAPLMQGNGLDLAFLTVPEAVTVEALTAGQYTLFYTFEDVAGNTATYNRALAIEAAITPRLTLAVASNSGSKIDTITTNTMPTIELTKFAANAEVTVTAMRTGVEDVTTTATVNETGATTVTLSTLSEGEWTVTAVVGADTIATTSLTIDNTAPLEGTVSSHRGTTLDSLGSFPLKGQGFTLTLPAAENGGRVEWTLTRSGEETPVIMEQTVALGATPTATLAVPEVVSATELTAGQYTLMYALTDAAGNTATYNREVGIRGDLVVSAEPLYMTESQVSGVHTIYPTDTNNPEQESSNPATQTPSVNLLEALPSGLSGFEGLSALNNLAPEAASTSINTVVEFVGVEGDVDLVGSAAHPDNDLWS